MFGSVAQRKHLVLDVCLPYLLCVCKYCTTYNFVQICQLIVTSQMPLLEAVCKDYLLSLKLRPPQLPQLVQLFDRLDYRDVLSKTLKKLCNKLWLPKVTTIIANVVQQ